MKKKIVSLMLIGTMILSMLAGCRTQDDAKTTSEEYLTSQVNPDDDTTTSEDNSQWTPDITPEEYWASQVNPDDKKTTRLEAILGLVDTALTYGRNIEGSRYPHLFADSLNVNTKEPVEWILNGDTYTTSNLYAQLNFLKILAGMTVLTGDESYKEIVLDQFRFYFDNLVDDSGLLKAGPHFMLDLITGRELEGSIEQHELKDTQLPWELMWEADPEGTERFISALWNSHISDMSSLSGDRHGKYNKEIGELWDTEYTNEDPYVMMDGIPFSCSVNDWMEAAWFLAEKTGDEKYAVWAERLLDKLIGITGETGLHGSQYGVLTSGDRFLLNFMGADFVTKSGVDFKTLTIDDYRIVGETALITRNGLKASTAYGPQNLIPIYERTGNQKIYDYVKNSMLALAENIYDAERHVLITPILRDGTDLNDGSDNKLIATADGYYVSAGKSFAESESVFGLTLKSAIDTCVMLKEEDSQARETIWNMARAYAKNIGWGDIGTSLGENVNVNLETKCALTFEALAAVTLYKHTKNKAYYDLACKIGDNIVKKFYEDGFFLQHENAAYGEQDCEIAHVVFCIEAMAQGHVDDITLDISHGGTDLIYDGKSRLSDSQIFYNRERVNVTRVEIDRVKVTLAKDENLITSWPDTAEHSAGSQIRQMASLGVLTGKDDGKFYPDESITRAEFVDMVVKLCGFSDTEKSASFSYTDVTEKDEHYNAVVAASNAGILDENLGTTTFDGMKLITREEMASIIVRALKAKNPGATYHIANALYRITDADKITAWAKDYVDIVCNYRLMSATEANEFMPQSEVSRAVAACALADLARYIELEDMTILSAKYEPSNADDTLVVWTTDNGSVVEVDQKGRLYPTGIGTAYIVATIGGRSDVIPVTVVAIEPHMIKSVSIDGVQYDRFDLEQKSYNVEVKRGVEKIPVVTAKSYSGETVQVKYPDGFPGTVELTVGDSAEKYSLYFEPAQIKYNANENYDSYELGTKYADTATDKYDILISNVSGFKNNVTIVQKNTVDQNADANDYCMEIPYSNEALRSVQALIYFKSGSEILLGENAIDDNYVIVEMDVAIGGQDTGQSGWLLHVSGRYTDIRAFAALTVIEDEMTMMNQPATARNLGKNTFHNIKLIVDKKNKTYSYFLDGEMLGKDMECLNEEARAIGSVGFWSYDEERDIDTKLYMDNIKVYELLPSEVEELLAQEPVAVQRPLEPTVTTPPNDSTMENTITYAVDENYNGFALKTRLVDTTTAEDNYSWFVSTKLNSTVTVVAKNTVDARAAEDDYCVELPFSQKYNTYGTFNLNLNADNIISLDDTSKGRYAVVEMDIAIGGDDAEHSYFKIHVKEPSADGIDSVAGVIAENANMYVYRYEDETAISMEKGKFYTVKFVIDKVDKTYKYYLDGELITGPNYFLDADVNEIGTVYFGIPLHLRNKFFSLYVDNVKVYQTNVE